MATYIVDVIRKLEQKVSFAVDAKNKAELDKKCKDLFNNVLNEDYLNERFEEGQTLSQSFEFANSCKLSKDERADYTEVVAHLD
jgi:hypothetical protein